MDVDVCYLNVLLSYCCFFFIGVLMEGIVLVILLWCFFEIVVVRLGCCVVLSM